MGSLSRGFWCLVCETGSSFFARLRGRPSSQDIFFLDRFAVRFSIYEDSRLTAVASDLFPFSPWIVLPAVIHLADPFSGLTRRRTIRSIVFLVAGLLLPENSSVPGLPTGL